MDVKKDSPADRPQGEQGLYVGIDIGSSALHYAVLDAGRAVVNSPDPIMHFANPLGALTEAWQDLLARFGREAIRSTALTGSAAEIFPRVMQEAIYVYDSVAIPKGVEVVAPEARYVFHIGAKDAYFFSVGLSGQHQVIREWRTGTKCGGGSGMLVEKQCRRLFQGEVPSPQLEDPGTDDDPQHSGERLLEAIQMAWIEERD